MLVRVLHCSTGQVQQNSSPPTCLTCPPVHFSFDPQKGQCDPCPSAGFCAGGAVLVPVNDYWHSAPDSDHMVVCPNRDACQNNQTELVACQTANYASARHSTNVGCSFLLVCISSLCVSAVFALFHCPIAKHSEQTTNLDAERVHIQASNVVAQWPSAMLMLTFACLHVH